MQKLCPKDWTNGVHVDDFVYELKKVAKHAKADNNLVCNILIGQLSKVIQSNAKTVFAEKKGTGLSVTPMLVFY